MDFRDFTDLAKHDVSFNRGFLVQKHFAPRCQLRRYRRTISPNKVFNQHRDGINRAEQSKRGSGLFHIPLCCESSWETRKECVYNCSLDC